MSSPGFGLDQATQLIAGFEGFRSMPYQDSAGVWTIGYGETDPGVIAQYRASGITQPEAFALLERRVQDFYNGVAAAVSPVMLNANQAAACSSLAYNIGSGAFSSSTVCARIKAGDFAGAASAFMGWTMAGGRVLPGLVTRRRAESALFLRPVAPGPQGDDDMMCITDPKDGSHASCDAAGNVFTFNPDGTPGGHFLGALSGHPEWNAGTGKANGPVVMFGTYDDGALFSAYVLTTRDAGGAFHAYRFPSNGSLAH